MLTLSLFVFSTNSLATPLVLQTEETYYDTKQFTHFLEDINGTLSYQDVKTLPINAFTPVTERPFSGGYSDSTFWFKLSLNYVVPAENMRRRHDWVLELDYAPLDYVDVYVPNGDNITRYQAGDMRPVSIRTFSNNYTIFYLRLTPNTPTDIFIRVQTKSSLQVPLTVWSPAGLYTEHSKSNLGYGIYFGILLIMAMYNLLLYFSLREKSYLFYVAYITAFGFLQGSISGLAMQYLWPAAVYWANTSIPFLMAVSTFFAVLFARYFLATNQQAPNTDRLLISIAVISIILAILTFFISYRISLTIGNILTMLVSIALIWAGIQASLRRFPGGPFFLMGWAALLIGSTIFMLVSAGFVMPNAFTTNAALYGSALEALLLALALGERIKNLRQDKDQIEEKAKMDLRAANQELSYSLTQLEQNNKLKDEFLARVSHELRTPLNGISGSIELMRLEDLSGIVDEYAQSAEVSAEHMLELVNTLLQFSEAQSKKTILVENIIDVAKVVEQLTQRFSVRFRAKGVRLITHIDRDLPPLLLGDEGKLCLILIQLLDNAIKFTEHGRVELNIKARKLSIAASQIEFQVRDTGTGIKQDELDHIFNPFSQGGSALTHRTGGLGMGLAICLQLVRLMKGAISTENVNEGASIIVVLPFSIPRETTDSTARD